MMPSARSTSRRTLSSSDPVPPYISLSLAASPPRRPGPPLASTSPLLLAPPADFRLRLLRRRDALTHAHRLPRSSPPVLVALFLVAVTVLFCSLAGVGALRRAVRSGDAPLFGIGVDGEVELPLPLQRANATLTILVNPRTNLFKDLLPTLTSLEARFNGQLGYPIQLLTDGALPDEGMRQRTLWATKGKAKWSLVDASTGFGPPAHVSPADISLGLKRIKGFTLGYRNMCRFFSLAYHHHPALSGFEWLWRLDEGVEFFCELMISTNSIYGYSQWNLETRRMVPTLWSHTQRFMAAAKEEHPEWFPEGRDEGFVTSPNGGYKLRMYYNNFEIVHRSFLESEPYRAYVNYLDKQKGFYLERWGDAPIRTLALAFFAPAAQIRSFENETGYYHPNPAFTCPDKPWCYCNPVKSRENGSGRWY
ncbi:hypothetical protein JCM8097_001155 [Rhodosporidiobolus ruineniae]